MTSNFYNRILNKIESYLTSTKTMTSSSPSKYKKSLSFSPQLLSSVSPNKLSTSSRLKKLASSIESIKPSKSLLRSSSSLSNNVIKDVRIEDRLQEEKAKNSAYLTEIHSLKLRIEDLNRQLHHYQHNHNCNCIHSHSHCNEPDIDALLIENEELRKFKENVFIVSKRYDDINENVLLSLKEIDQLFTQMNNARGSSEGEMAYSKQMHSIETSINTFENVINTIVNMMKSKQDEYNFLIESREKEINQLCRDKSRLEDYIRKLELENHNNHIHSHYYIDEHHCNVCYKTLSLCICYPEKDIINKQRLQNSKSNSFIDN